MSHTKASRIMAVVACSAFGISGAVTINVDNPDQAKYTKTVEGKARSAEAIKAGQDEVLKKSASTMKYIETHGVTKAIEEMNKGKDGALAASMPSEYAYYSIEQVIDATKGKVMSCNVKSFVGWEFEPMKVNGVDGWNYKGAYWKAAVDRKKEYWDASKKQGKIWVNNVVFTDPGWAKGTACRFNVLLTYFESEGKLYYIFLTHWLDE